MNNLYTVVVNKLYNCVHSTSSYMTLSFKPAIPFSLWPEDPLSVEIVRPWWLFQGLCWFKIGLHAIKTGLHSLGQYFYTTDGVLNSRLIWWLNKLYTLSVRRLTTFYVYFVSNCMLTSQDESVIRFCKEFHRTCYLGHIG